MAVNSYVGGGGDGFDCFTKESVKTLVNPENTLQVLDLLVQFFKRTSTSFKVKKINEARLQGRLKLFNTALKNSADVSPDGKFVMIRP